MKKTILLLTFLLLSIVSMQAQQPPPAVAINPETGTWIKLEPAHAGFTILMPRKPSERATPVEGRPGVTNHELILETKLAGYVVSYVEFPEEVMDPDAIKSILDNGRDGGIASSKAELTSENEIKLKQFAGREWMMKLPNGLLATARAYWVRRRLYQTILVISPNANDSSELVKLRQEAGTRFLDSFTLSGDNVAR
jgi:hypothetical protein